MNTHFSVQAQEAAYLVLRYVLPRTSSIALISCGVGWYAHIFTRTYLSNEVASTFAEKWNQVCGTPCRFAGTLIAPFFANPDSHYMTETARYVSIGATVTTSVVLNLIAQVFFGVKRKDDPLPPPGKLFDSKPGSAPIVPPNFLSIVSFETEKASKVSPVTVDVPQVPKDLKVEEKMENISDDKLKHTQDDDDQENESLVDDDKGDKDSHPGYCRWLYPCICP
jgi:hypothetical protein